MKPIFAIALIAGVSFLLPAAPARAADCAQICLNRCSHAPGNTRELCINRCTPNCEARHAKKKKH